MPEKNTRPFAGIEGGLIELKLRQLMELEDCHLLLSTNDEAVIDIAERVLSGTDLSYSIDRRPDHLGASTTSTDDLIAYVPSLVSHGDVLWTHVTSPFIDASSYRAALSAYRRATAEGTHDSLVSVALRQTFLWDEDGPINYDRTVERWPRTQTLRKLWEINSAIFIAPLEAYVEGGDRIGQRPMMFEIDELDGFEIDRVEQFDAAERLMLSRQP